MLAGSPDLLHPSRAEQTAHQQRDRRGRRPATSGDRPAFPSFIGEGADAENVEREVPVAFREDVTVDEAAERTQVTAPKTGNIQMIDNENVMDVARKHDLVLRLQYQPGDLCTQAER